MKKKIQKMGFTFVILTMLVITLFAQEQPPLPETSDNFRINVVTDKNSHVTGGRLNLMLELLNNSSKETYIVLPEPNETQVLSDEPVDGEPNIPPIIGIARLIPLRRPTLVEDEGNEQANAESPEGPPAVKRIPLRLLGGPVITAHSTVIISIASMPLAHRPVPEESEEKPLNQQSSTENNDELIGIRPGLYLLDCEVNAIAGIPEAHAEKIIRILPPPHDNGRRPNQAQKPQR